MNLATLTDNLAVHLRESIDGVHTSGFLPAKIVPTHLFVERAALEYLVDQTPAGMRANLTLTAVFGTGQYDKGQKALDDYLSSEGDRSVFAAVQAAGDLDGACDFIVCRGVDTVGEIEVRGNVYIGARFTLEALG